MKSLVLLLFILTISLRSVTSKPNMLKDSQQWSNWKKSYKFTFSTAQESYRMKIFIQNLRAIQAHNSNPSKTYQKGVNKFTVYSQNQFQKLFLINGQRFRNKGRKQNNGINNKNNNDSLVSLPQIDWSASGKVTFVKNQGQCGSCWAFSALAVVQSFKLISSNQNLDLSQQQLVDCATFANGYGNYGCNGGWPSNALNYVKAVGVTTQQLYPYKAINDLCKKIGGDYKINAIKAASGCTGLQSAIISSPISVAVDASGWSTYKSGVFSSTKKKANLNHAVLLVGIVKGNWKIKNSWGNNWGETGYMRLAPGSTSGICLTAGSYVQ